MKTTWMMALIFLLTTSIVQAQNSTQNQKFKYENLVSFDDVIWGMDFLNKQEIILTLRSGKMYIYNIGTQKKTQIKNIPKVYASGQGGLLDVRVAPWDNKRIFFTYSVENPKEKPRTVLAHAYLENDQLNHFKIILETISQSSDTIHFGSRIEFDDQNNIYMTVGDRNDRDKVQSLKHHNGKVLKLSPTKEESRYTVEIFSFGHRNPQGLTTDPVTKKMWLSEHGPRGGDEINLLEKGQNYGWPDVTYGKEYYGPTIGVKEKAGTVQPVVYWVPSISPAGIIFYTGDKFPDWKNNLFVTALSGQQVRRLTIEKDQVKNQEEMLTDKRERYRAIRQGADGFIYLATDSGNIARLTP